MVVCAVFSVASAAASRSCWVSRLVVGARNAEGYVLVGLDKVRPGGELFCGRGIDLSLPLAEVEDQIVERNLGTTAGISTMT